jgi:hypothetical protein
MRRLEDNIKVDFSEGGWGMDWVDLAEDRDKWQAFVNSIMNHPVTKKNAGNFLIAEDLLASQEGCCYMKCSECLRVS